MKKKSIKNIQRPVLVLFTLTLLFSLLFPATVALANDDVQLAELRKQEEAIKKKQAESKKKSETLQQNINQVKQQERTTASEIKLLETEIMSKDAELENLTLQIEETQTKEQIATVELQQAEERVAKRDNVLKSRVRSMYENGKVSYLEVLLGSNSFIDFLNRFEALNLIIEQDRRILNENKQDREIIFAKKTELEEHRQQLQNLYAQTEVVKNELSDRERKQKVQLSSLTSDREQLNKLLDEEEAEQKKLISELNKVVQQYRRIYSGTGIFGWPLDSMVVTSGYGNRKNPFGTGRTEWHNGVDFRASTGTPIYATEDGVVILSGWVRGFGWTAIIDHGSGITSLYGHNSELAVKEGQTVKKGQLISKAGATGNVTGPHLHFTIYENGKDVNPSKYVTW